MDVHLKGDDGDTNLQLEVWTWNFDTPVDGFIGSRMISVKGAGHLNLIMETWPTNNKNSFGEYLKRLE